MFISFFLPYSPRFEAMCLWVFYEQLIRFESNDVIFIASEDYFKDPDYYRSKNRDELKYYNPDDKLDKVLRYFVDQEIFSDLEKKFVSPCQIWKSLITERHEKLESKLEEIFSDIFKNYKDIDGVLTWLNIPSLNHVANKFGLKVIHNEVGALREPYYIYTAYFDFKGVNGNTECHERYLKFREEIDKEKVEIFEKHEILELIGKNKHYYETLDLKQEEYEAGIPLQVEDDSNVLAFSNGLNNFELIMAVKRLYDNVLIRKHPHGYLEYKDNLGKIDNSATPIDFIRSCKRIFTINSSVGLESVLFDKEVYILGENPFNYLANNRLDQAGKVDEELIKLNFAIFGYLMPRDLLFNKEYYRWRLSFPSEIEIYNRHLDYYFQVKPEKKLWRKLRNGINKVNEFANFNQGKKVCFWGAGSFAEEFLAMYDLAERLDILGFIDNKKSKTQEKINNKYNIYSTDELERLNPDIIIPTVFEKEYALPDIERFAQNSNLHFEIIHHLFDKC